MSVRYTRRFTNESVGTDVEEVGRALCRAKCGPKGGLVAFMALPEGARRRWGWRHRRWLRKFKRKHGLTDTAVYGPKAHRALSPHFDARGRQRMAAWRPPLKLVPPRQGWSSLDKTLWALYAIAVTDYGMSDLGTYNPSSRLPGGGVSDHAKGPPALAMDLGIDPDVGMRDPEGRAFFHHCVGDRRVEYVILGDRIWAQSRKSEGIRPYTSGGHLNHAHVSARHSRLVRLSIRAQDLFERALA